MSDTPPTEPAATAAPPPTVDDQLMAMDAAYALIEQGVRLIAITRPARQAERLRAAIDASFILDPTIAMRVMRQREDMDRKLKILDDAARLVGNWQIVEVPGG